jgi:hypothetical protein
MWNDSLVIMVLTLPNPWSSFQPTGHAGLTWNDSLVTLERITLMRKTMLQASDFNPRAHHLHEEDEAAGVGF